MSGASVPLVPPFPRGAAPADAPVEIASAAARAATHERIVLYCPSFAVMSALLAQVVVLAWALGLDFDHRVDFWVRPLWQQAIGFLVFMPLHLLFFFVMVYLIRNQFVTTRELAGLAPLPQRSTYGSGVYALDDADDDADAAYDQPRTRLDIHVEANTHTSPIAQFMIFWPGLILVSSKISFFPFDGANWYWMMFPWILQLSYYVTVAVRHRNWTFVRESDL